MIVNITLFLLFSLLLYLSKSETLPEDFIQKKYKIIHIFYKMGQFLYKLKKSINKKKKSLEGKIYNNLKYLSPGKSIHEIVEVYYSKKIGIFLLILFLFNTLSFILNFQEGLNSGQESLVSLSRPLQGSRFYNLDVSIGEIKEPYKMVVQVEEMWMSEEEISSLFEKSYEYLKEAILGENPSFEEVSSKLYFPESIPDTEIIVNWETENYQYIDSFGNIMLKERKEEIPTYVRATLSYKEYKEEYQFYINLVPEKVDAITKMQKNLDKLIMEEEKKQKEAEKLILPTEVEGKKVAFYEVQENEGGNIFLFGLLLAIIIFVFHDRRLSEKIKRKNNVLMTTYPELVAKLTLLICAGMTIGRGWERIVFDYKKRGVHNYAYEEMEVTYYEIQKGISEGKAYGSFGKRCRLHPYIKLGGLLEQNLKKGNKGLEQLLREEVKEAFEDRKSRAKQLGEEASTKLLMPMFLMLAVVLIICMAPAFMGF